LDTESVRYATIVSSHEERQIVGVVGFLLGLNHHSRFAVL
jgi:hypothetical protein